MSVLHPAARSLTAGDLDALDDGALVALARLRDEPAIRALTRRYNRRLFRLARSVLRNDSEAEDVVQEAWVRAFTALDGFRGEAAFATWLTRIALNEALGRRRRERPTLDWETYGDTASEAEIINFPVSAMVSDPERTMARSEMRDVLERSIDELPDAFRLVFMTRIIEGMNVEETADLLGLKPETVKTRLHRARAMLRDNVERKIGPIVLEAFPFAGRRCGRLTEAVLKRLGFFT